MKPIPCLLLLFSNFLFTPTSGFCQSFEKKYNFFELNKNSNDNVALFYSLNTEKNMEVSPSSNFGFQQRGQVIEIKFATFNTISFKNNNYNRITNNIKTYSGYNHDFSAAAYLLPTENNAGRKTLHFFLGGLLGAGLCTYLAIETARPDVPNPSIGLIIGGGFIAGGLAAVIFW